MMLPEVRVFRLLSAQESLILLMDTIRKKKFDGTNLLMTGIFTYEIEATYRKKELAPFIRINPIDEQPAIFMDDDNVAEDQTVQVDFWCKTASDSGRMKKEIDNSMKRAGYVQYASVRYKDPDIDLILNVRKYRILDFKNYEEKEV